MIRSMYWPFFMSIGGKQTSLATSPWTLLQVRSEVEINRFPGSMSMMSVCWSFMRLRTGMSKVFSTRVPLNWSPIESSLRPLHVHSLRHVCRSSQCPPSFWTRFSDLNEQLWQPRARRSSRKRRWNLVTNSNIQRWKKPVKIWWNSLVELRI